MGKPAPSAVTYELNDAAAVALFRLGWLNQPGVDALATPLSSVRVPLDQIAANAIDLIVNPDREPRVRRSMPTLIPRQSSGAPRRSPIKVTS